MKKFKNWLKSKTVKVAVAASACAAALCMGASAVDGESNAAITTAFTTGFQQIASDALSMIAVIVPIALGVAGTVFVVRKAMSWFKGLAK